MNAVILAIEVLGIVAMVLVHRHQLKGLSSFFEDRLRAQDEAEEGRRLAAFKQAKAVTRRSAESEKTVRRVADKTREMQEEVTRSVRRLDRLADDLKRGGEHRG